MNHQPTIITFPVQDDSGLFLLQSKNDMNHKISVENEPPIVMSNKHNLTLKHPFSLNEQSSKNRSEPLFLSPHSILNKSGQISSAPNVLNDSRNDRRPSLVTFSNDVSSYTSNNTVFYDALAEQEKRKKSISTYNNSRRPSVMSRISSAYTNKVANIPFHEIDPFDQHLLQQGIVLCATVTFSQQEAQKRPLRWKKYKAVITQSGYLEMYYICKHKEQNFLQHTVNCIHSHLPRYKKPRFIIDLHPSTNNNLFHEKHLFHKHHRLRAQQFLDDTYFLSLMSPVDFSWSLTSTRRSFYFQADSVKASQQWYQSLYACLPGHSKKPLPAVVDLSVPELSVCIRLPISELIHLGEENIDLKKVRDSALVLLHRYGHRPAQWTRRTTGLRWRYNQQSDWVVEPYRDDDQDEITAFLIEARLIEKTHELELHFFQEKEQEEEEEKELKSAPLEGYLKRTTKRGKCVLFYAQLQGHLLFLFETEQDPQQQQEKNCFSVLLSKKRHRICPSNKTSVLKQVVDLSQIKTISCDEKEEKLRLGDNGDCFQSVNAPITDWSSRILRIIHGSPGGEELKMCDVLYVKSAAHRYQTFEKKTCILTKSGMFCMLNKDGGLDLYSHLWREEHYIYSGATCCSYIAGLPVELPCRLFDSGIIEQHDKPNQCCFVVCFTASGNEFVFLTKTQDQKEDWVGAIAN
ncbi:hypothetical protein [Parasitella parasitica]|uniref:PH domain-containing protein n=1 Tax=Parasitella parasitica TaxID=35722 RepID=A0A0B7N9B3_9FUNG|nr:hypothetical protein [Parasitella parasitica]